jgi:Fic family protein
VTDSNGADESPVVISQEKARELDTQYQGIPKFGAWSGLVVATEYWDPRLAALETVRGSAGPDRVESATRAAMKAAAFDTGAIEGLYQPDRGFTIAVATQTAAWDTLLNNYEETARDLIKAQLATYELALDVATGHLPINEALIRRMHEELTAPQETYKVLTPLGVQDQPLPRGKYKEQPNHVRVRGGGYHAYAPVDRTPAEMHALVEELGGELFQSAHPVLQASYAHYAFIAIHPFADGNGRVARALASIYLYRSNRIPLLITADTRNEYFDALERADRGDHQPFVDFVFERAMETMQLVASALAPDPVDQLPAFNEFLQAHGGMTHAEMDRIAQQIMNHVHEVLTQVVGGITLPTGVGLNFSLTHLGAAASLPGYRNVMGGGGSGIQINLSSQAPAQGAVGIVIRIMVAMTDRQRYPFILDVVGAGNNFEIRKPDVLPTYTTTFDLLLTSWLRARLGVGVSSLKALAEAAMRQQGYR